MKSTEINYTLPNANNTTNVNTWRIFDSKLPLSYVNQSNYAIDNYDKIDNGFRLKFYENGFIDAYNPLTNEYFISTDGLTWQRQRLKIASYGDYYNNI